MYSQIHIDERKTETTYELAVLADEYAVTHRRSKGKPNFGTQTPNKGKCISYEKGQNIQLFQARPIIAQENKSMTCQKTGAQYRKMLDLSEQ